MRYSRDVENIYLVATCGDLMHEIVRGFALKHGLRQSLAQMPEVAWEWIFAELRYSVLELDADTRFKLASWCFQAIRDRMRRVHEGGENGVH